MMISPTIVLMNPACDAPGLASLSVHWLGRGGEPGGPKSFDLRVEASDTEPDVWPLVVEGATRAQSYLDNCALHGMPLLIVLDTVERMLDALAGYLYGEDPHRSMDGTVESAVTGLLILRSFGRADDTDEYRGFVPVWNLLPREFPTLQWNGAHGQA